MPLEFLSRGKGLFAKIASVGVATALSLCVHGQPPSVRTPIPGWMFLHACSARFRIRSRARPREQELHRSARVPKTLQPTRNHCLPARGHLSRLACKPPTREIGSIPWPKGHFLTGFLTENSPRRSRPGRIDSKVPAVLNRVRAAREAMSMPETKSAQWKSCSMGHLYLGLECPCERFDRYRPGKWQSRPQPSRNARLDTQVAHGRQEESA